MNNVTKRGMVDAGNGGAPYTFWIAIVPVLDTTPGNFSVDRAARVNYAALRARKITRVFERQRRRGSNGGNFAVFRQPGDLSGCFGSNHPSAVTTVIFRGAADRLSVQPISTPHYPSAVISPFATILRRIRNRRLRRFRGAGRFTQFDGRPRNRYSITSSDRAVR